MTELWQVNEQYHLTRYYMSGGFLMFILYNFMKQAVLGLHTYFKLMVSPFYFPHDRVANLGVMFVVQDKVIHTPYRTTLLSSGENSSHVQSLKKQVSEYHKEQIILSSYNFLPCVHLTIALKNRYKLQLQPSSWSGSLSYLKSITCWVTSLPKHCNNFRDFEITINLRIFLWNWQRVVQK